MMEMVSFASPYWLAGLALLPVTLFLMRRARRKVILHFSPRAASGAPWPAVQERARPTILALCIDSMLVVAGAGIVLSLAGPIPAPHESQSVRKILARDIVYVFDLSLSMEGYVATFDGKNITKLDLQLEFLSRLTDWVATHFPEDRIGAVVFGDKAFGVWPLSNDHAVLLERLQAAAFPAQLRGTKIILGLEAGIAHLNTFGQSHEQILVLATDGIESFDSADEQHILELWKEGGDGVRRTFILAGMVLNPLSGSLRICEKISKPELCFNAEGKTITATLNSVFEKFVSLPSAWITIPAETPGENAAAEPFQTWLRRGAVLLLISWCAFVSFWRQLPYAKLGEPIGKKQDTKIL